MSALAKAIEEGVIGRRVWFYANYHCNLECTYCLTESGPAVPRRLLDGGWMRERAEEAKALGFTSLGITGGEPFMVPSMPATIAALSQVLPTLVLSNATLFVGSRLDRVAEALAGRDVHIQISLDAPDAAENDTKRGDANFSSVVNAIPRLLERGIKVRIATTTEGLEPGDLERLCSLHRSWGVSDDDHVVRPIVARGRAATAGLGVAAGPGDVDPELCLTADGAFWSAFGPTVRDGVLNTDFLLTRTTAPLRVPAEALLRVAGGQPRGTDSSLGIR